MVKNFIQVQGGGREWVRQCRLFHSFSLSRHPRRSDSVASGTGRGGRWSLGPGWAFASGPPTSAPAAVWSCRAAPELHRDDSLPLPANFHGCCVSTGSVSPPSAPTVSSGQGAAMVEQTHDMAGGERDGDQGALEEAETHAQSVPDSITGEPVHVRCPPRLTVKPAASTTSTSLSRSVEFGRRDNTPQAWTLGKPPGSSGSLRPTTRRGRDPERTPWPG